MTARSRLVLVTAALALAGCSISPAPPTPQTLSSTPTTVPSPAPSPSATPIPPTALLDIRGDGTIQCYSPGGCGAALLLQPSDDGALPTHLDYFAPMQFTTDRPSFEKATLVGPVAGAPPALAPGRWRVGLGLSSSSDELTCDSSPCTSPDDHPETVLLCSTDFEVAGPTQVVHIRAHFGDKCSIDVQLEPRASSSPPPAAQLQIRGSGSVSCIDFEGCGAALILDPGVHDLGADWNPNDWDATFDVERVSSARAQLLGSISGAPHQIAIGSWTIGLVHVRISDVPTCGNPCLSPIPNYYGTVLCSRVVQVDEGARSVDIEAAFDEPCRIDVQISTSTVPYATDP